jgi:ATP-binding cassette, subfamily C, bacterial LapB
LTLIAATTGVQNERAGAVRPRARTAPSTSRLVAPSVFAATLASNLLALALPLVLLQAYDRIIPKAATSTLAALMIGLTVVLLLDALVRIVRAAVMAWATARYEYRASCALVERMLHAPIDVFEQSPVGRRMERFTAVDVMREFYGGQGAQNLVDLPFMLIFLALIGLIGGHLVLVPLAVAVLCGLAVWLMGRRLNHSLKARDANDDRRYSFVVEVLNGIENVKGLALETLMARRYERLLASSAHHSSDIAYCGAMNQAAGAIGANAAMIGLACLGALEVLSGGMSTGALGACTLLAGRSIQPLTRAVAIWTQYQSIKLARQRLAEALDLPQEAAGLAANDPAASGIGLSGDIRLSGVEFGYGTRAPLIRGLDLEVRAGEFVSIGGNSGVGKSTLLRLMMGMGTPQTGDIAYDGVSIRELGPAVVRANIAFLPQQPLLFRGTLRDNLVQFAGGAAEMRALALANELGLNEVIARLPDGLETWIGDDMSYALPSGVRQKIAIVRALVADPPIILFDEANSNFDQEGDLQLGALLARLRQEKTIVMVSHRPSLQRMADRHLVFEDGRLVPTERTGAAP